MTELDMTLTHEKPMVEKKTEAVVEAEAEVFQVTCDAEEGAAEANGSEEKDDGGDGPPTPPPLDLPSSPSSSPVSTKQKDFISVLDSPLEDLALKSDCVDQRDDRLGVDDAGAAAVAVVDAAVVTNTMTTTTTAIATTKNDAARTTTTTTTKTTPDVAASCAPPPPPLMPPPPPPSWAEESHGDESESVRGTKEELKEVDKKENVARTKEGEEDKCKCVDALSSMPSGDDDDKDDDKDDDDKSESPHLLPAPTTAPSISEGSDIGADDATNDGNDRPKTLDGETTSVDGDKNDSNNGSGSGADNLTEVQKEGEAAVVISGVNNSNNDNDNDNDNDGEKDQGEQITIIKETMEKEEEEEEKKIHSSTATTKKRLWGFVRKRTRKITNDPASSHSVSAATDAARDSTTATTTAVQPITSSSAAPIASGDEAAGGVEGTRMEDANHKDNDSPSKIVSSSSPHATTSASHVDPAISIESTTSVAAVASLAAATEEGEGDILLVEGELEEGMLEVALDSERHPNGGGGAVKASGDDGDDHGADRDDRHEHVVSVAVIENSANSRANTLEKETTGAVVKEEEDDGVCAASAAAKGGRDDKDDHNDDDEMDGNECGGTKAGGERRWALFGRRTRKAQRQQQQHQQQQQQRPRKGRNGGRGEEADVGGGGISSPPFSSAGDGSGAAGDSGNQQDEKVEASSVKFSGRHDGANVDVNVDAAGTKVGDDENKWRKSNDDWGDGSSEWKNMNLREKGNASGEEEGNQKRIVEEEGKERGESVHDEAKGLLGSVPVVVGDGTAAAKKMTASASASNGGRQWWGGRGTGRASDAAVFDRKETFEETGLIRDETAGAAAAAETFQAKNRKALGSRDGKKQGASKPRRNLWGGNGNGNGGGGGNGSGSGGVDDDAAGSGPGSTYQTGSGGGGGGGNGNDEPPANGGRGGVGGRNLASLISTSVSGLRQRRIQAKSSCPPSDRDAFTGRRKMRISTAVDVGGEGGTNGPPANDWKEGLRELATAAVLAPADVLEELIDGDSGNGDREMGHYRTVSTIEDGDSDHDCGSGRGEMSGALPADRGGMEKMKIGDERLADCGRPKWQKQALDVAAAVLVPELYFAQKASEEDANADGKGEYRFVPVLSGDSDDDDDDKNDGLAEDDDDDDSIPEGDDYDVDLTGCRDDSAEMRRRVRSLVARVRQLESLVDQKHREAEMWKTRAERLDLELMVIKNRTGEGTTNATMSFTSMGDFDFGEEDDRSGEERKRKKDKAKPEDGRGASLIELDEVVDEDDSSDGDGEGDENDPPIENVNDDESAKEKEVGKYDEADLLDLGGVDDSATFLVACTTSKFHDEAQITDEEEHSTQPTSQRARLADISATVEKCDRKDSQDGLAPSSDMQLLEMDGDVERKTAIVGNVDLLCLENDGKGATIGTGYVEEKAAEERILIGLSA